MKSRLGTLLWTGLLLACSVAAMAAANLPYQSWTNPDDWGTISASNPMRQYVWNASMQDVSQFVWYLPSRIAAFNQRLMLSGVLSINGTAWTPGATDSGGQNTITVNHTKYTVTGSVTGSTSGITFAISSSPSATLDLKIQLNSAVYANAPFSIGSVKGNFDSGGQIIAQVSKSNFDGNREPVKTASVIYHK